ncbi:MAG: DUF4105 domain-containing protein [Victivallaceae bacterium]
MAIIRKLQHWTGVILYLPFFLCALLLYLWSVGALVYCLDIPDRGRLGVILIFSGVYLGCWIFVRYRYRALAFVLAALPVMFFFGSIKPEPGTLYQTAWARQPSVTFESDGLITIGNIRDFRYRSESEYTVNYRTLTFDPKRCEKLYFAISRWDGLQNIGHTMLTFAFSDGKSVTVSVETRVPVGKEQGTVAGLYKQFGLGSLYGTESDLLKLRATYRGETLYLYPTRATPEVAAQAFILLAKRAAKLEKQPEFYNTLTANCTTTLVSALRPLLFNWKPDPRVILNGRLDLLGFEKGYLDFGGAKNLEEAQSRYRVLAGHDEEGDDYARVILKK